MIKKALLLVAALMLASCVVSMAPMEPQAPYGLSYEPPLAVVPGTYIYAAPDTPGLFFYQGFWYRHYGDRWYMATRYDSDRWSYMRDTDVPRGIYYLPPDYRNRLQDRDRIRTDDVQHNWRQWEQDRRWDREPVQQDKGRPAPNVQQDKGRPLPVSPATGVQQDRSTPHDTGRPAPSVQQDKGRPAQGVPAIGGQQDKGVQDKDKGKAKVIENNKGQQQDKDKNKVKEKDKEKDKPKTPETVPAGQPRQ